jgi:hypothetical protein
MAAKMVERRGGGFPWRVAGWSVAALLLVQPAVAMQFTSQVNWSGGDFLLMGALLGGAGLGIELAVRKSASPAYRAGAALALLAGFLTVVVNGAVGIIGSENEAANLFYLAAPAFALIGAAAARFRAAGMAWAMTAAGLATLLVPVIAIAFRLSGASAVWSPEVPVATGVLAGLWFLSAWLLRRAA